MECIHCNYFIEEGRTDEHKAYQNCYGEFICEACENNHYIRCERCKELVPIADSYNGICDSCDIEMNVPLQDITGRVI